MYRLACFMLSLALLLPAYSLAGPLEDKLQQTMNDHPAARRTNLALKVVDLESGETLADIGGEKLFIPASNLKIYTSACALDVFGPDHSFTTRFLAASEPRAGVVEGDLVFKAGGDPMLNTSDLRGFVRKLKQEAQVRQVRGNLIVDTSLFRTRLKGPGWMWDDDPDDYNMSISAAMLNYNVLSVVLDKAPGNAMPKGRLVPASAEPPILVLPLGLQEEKELRVTRQPFKELITVSGTVYAREDAASTYTLTMHDPAPWVGSVLKEMLAEEGVAVLGQVQVRTERGTEGVTLAELPSRPISAQITRFNKVSENAIGEMLLHHLALKGGAEYGNWPEGAAFIRKWLVEKAGLDKTSFHLVDGSGLSRYNLISADSSVRLLQFMWRHPHKQVFVDSLPVYEVVNGKGEKVKAVFAKPGGMSGVSTLSGYLRTRSGKTLAFSYLANGYTGSNAPISDLRGKLFTILHEQ